MGRYNYTKALKKTTEWAENEGFSVLFEDDGVSEIDCYNSEIKIENVYTTEYKVYILLHELGHYQLRKNWDKFNKVLPIAAQAEHLHFTMNVGKFMRRISYSVACLEEEFKAWEEGLKLADKLEIKVNMSNWLDFKSKCIITYIRYYSTKK